MTSKMNTNVKCNEGKRLVSNLIFSTTKIVKYRNN